MPPVRRDGPTEGRPTAPAGGALVTLDGGISLDGVTGAKPEHLLVIRSAGTLTRRLPARM